MERAAGIEYTTWIWSEGGQYVAHAMPLDVMSSGPNPEAARKALAEAVQLFLDTAAETGTLDEVLQECGYELTEGQWKSPAWVCVERGFAKLAS